MVVGAAGSEAALWTATTGIQTLGPLVTGGSTRVAWDVSPDGQTIFGDGLVTGTMVGFRWEQATGAVPLVGMFPPTTFGVTEHDSDLTSTIITFTTIQAPLTNNAALLTPTLTQVTNLSDHLLSLGATGLNGWQLTSSSAISLDGRTIVGQGENPAGDTEGWVARLGPAGSNVIGMGYCSNQAPNTTGMPAMLTATGFTEANLNTVTLQASQLPSNEFGFFLNSQVQAFFPMAGGSAGNLCLGGAIGRYNSNVFSTGTGQASLTLNLLSTPTPGSTVLVMAGQSWNFQAWFRDTAGGGTSNVSNGQNIVFQ